MSLFLNYSEGFLTEVCHSQLQLQLSFSVYSTVGIWHHFVTQWLDFTFNKAFNILKVLANKNIAMPTTLYSFFPYNWKLDLWHYSKKPGNSSVFNIRNTFYLQVETRKIWFCCIQNMLLWNNSYSFRVKKVPPKVLYWKLCAMVCTDTH